MNTGQKEKCITIGKRAKSINVVKEERKWRKTERKG